MFFIPRPKHAKKVDVGLAIYNQLIAEKGEEIANACVKDCKKIQKLRTALHHQPNEDTGKMLLRYLASLQMLEGVNLTELKVDIQWANAFSIDDIHVCNDIEADIIGTLFNLGVCEATEAKSQYLADNHSAALQKYQQSAGYFRMAGEHMFMGTWDVQGGCLRALANCMLGNAQMVFYESIKERFGAAMMARLVAGASQLYRIAGNEVEKHSSIGKQAEMSSIFCAAKARELQVAGYRDIQDTSNLLACLKESVKEVDSRLVRINEIGEENVEEIREYVVRLLTKMRDSLQSEYEQVDEKNRLIGFIEVADQVEDIKPLRKIQERRVGSIIEGVMEEMKKELSNIGKMVSE